MADRFLRFVSLIELKLVCWWCLNLTRNVVRLFLVKHQKRRKPSIEQRILREMVRIRRPLKQLNLRQHFKLLPLLVKVYQSIGNRVRDGSMNHRQVRKKCPQVRYCPMADESVLLLKHLLQVTIILTDSISKL